VSPTADRQCLAGALATDEPGALQRGGNWNSGASAGPLAVTGQIKPSTVFLDYGFRCAR
jgi:hypothetical protein